MVIIPLTLVVSLSLVFSFLVFFVAEHRRSKRGGADRDSLLPLAEETSLIQPDRHPSPTGDTRS
jgi:hypothetical protein